MASFQSFLHVGGKQYEILYSNLGLGQALDSLGRPASLTQGGVFTIEINTPGSDDPTLTEWMVNPTKILDGKVVLKRIDSNATLKLIKFFNAYCVGMDIKFDGTANAVNFRTTLHISPEQVEIDGLLHDNKWPEETPIREIGDEGFSSQPTAAKSATLKEAKETEPGLLSDIAHGVLDVAGMVPVVGELADGANALFYLAEGNKTDAALSAAAMIPIAGWAATGAKLVRKGVKIANEARALGKIKKIRKILQRFPNGIPPEVGTKLTENVRKKLANAKPKLKPSQNVAVAEVVINGKRKFYEAVSGKISPPNTTPSPNELNRIFKTKMSGAMTRAYDTEVKILEEVARSIGANAKGTISLFTERAPCFSCKGVIKQFEQMFPDIKIIVTNNP